SVDHTAQLSLTAYPPGPPSAASMMPSRTTFTSVLVLPTMTPSSFSVQEARAVCSLSWCSQVHPSNHASREVVSSSRWAALSTSGALCVLVSLVLAVVPDSVVVPHAVSASVSTAAAASGVCSFMMRLSLVWYYLCQERAGV